MSPEQLKSRVRVLEADKEELLQQQRRLKDMQVC
jgi:hypothetical protein